jgi:hypothetical protein
VAIVLACLRPDPRERPAIHEVIARLKGVDARPAAASVAEP